MRYTSFRDHASNRNGGVLARELEQQPLLRVSCNVPTSLGYQGCSINDYILVITTLHTPIRMTAHIGAYVTNDHVPLLTYTTLFDRNNQQTSG